MARFNLIEEPWIRVLSMKTGEQKEVSMREMFRNAGDYKALAGEMETQNFAVLRFLLSVLQTVFSRFDMEGKTLPGIEINERWIQTEPVDEDDLEDFIDASDECWENLYKAGRFPDIVTDYLEMWKERFYLFDEEYPFLQINKREMDEIMRRIPKKNQPTIIYGKNLNRTISESENKSALFSPVNNGNKKRGKKDVLSEAELIRWLLTFQGYTGLADKVSITSEKQRSSKGWLFDLGGIYLQGDNLFETLMMNLIIGSALDKQSIIGRIQRPCWESTGIEAVNKLCQGVAIDNLAELYTNRSRAVYIDTKFDMSNPVEIQVVKLPEIEHADNFIEPMTLWRLNKDGPNKNRFTPKKHSAEQSLWRSFGMITMKSSVSASTQQHPPGIHNQYKRLAKAAGSRWSSIVGVSMQDDGNATSWLPINEIVDNLRINDLVIADAESDGWIVRINDAVETTKSIIDWDYKAYLKGICTVRNLKLTEPVDPIAIGFISKETAEMYAVIDPEFREWISSIKPEDSKEDRIKEWYELLRELVLRQGEKLFNNSTSRDLKGIETDSGFENIATKYWQFFRNINFKLNKGGKQ